MNCKHVQPKMVDYCEKLLNQEEYVQIEQHLQQCGTCAQELAEIEQTLHLLHTVPFAEPPEAFWTDFTSRVMRKIHTMDAPAPTNPWFFLPRWKMGLAAAALIGILGGGYWGFQANIHRTRSAGDPQGLSPVVSQAEPGQPLAEEAFTTALRKIAPSELTKDMLDADLALFEGTAATAIESEESDETLALLINSLTAEEKQALLAELYKLRDVAQ